jgi:hypothetical protein
VDKELTGRYRYAAVSNHADGTGPLAAYFHGEMMNLPGASASIFDRNKFLAEDRILAFGSSSSPLLPPSGSTSRPDQADI